MNLKLQYNYLFITDLQLVKKTAKQIVGSDGGHVLDISGIQLALAEKQSEVPHSGRSAIPVILPDSDVRSPR